MTVWIELIERLCSRIYVELLCILLLFNRKAVWVKKFMPIEKIATVGKKPGLMHAHFRTINKLAIHSLEMPQDLFTTYKMFSRSTIETHFQTIWDVTECPFPWSMPIENYELWTWISKKGKGNWCTYIVIRDIYFFPDDTVKRKDIVRVFSKKDGKRARRKLWADFLKRNNFSHDGLWHVWACSDHCRVHPEAR